DGATPPVNATAAYGDTFIDSLLGNISSLIPTITGDGPSHTVGDQIYSGLVTFDKDLNPVGELAQSWEFSRDCRDLTFRLRPGVKWHDGRPFTADDVVFTWQTIVDPKTPSPYKSEYALVESVRAEGAAVGRVPAPRPPDHPEPGHDLPRPDGEGRGRHGADRAAVQPADRLPRVPARLHEVPPPRQRLHLPRLQPQGLALRRSPRAPGLRLRHQQARGHRRRAAGPRARGHRPLQAGDVGLHRQGEDVPVPHRASATRSSGGGRGG